MIYLSSMKMLEKLIISEILSKYDKYISLLYRNISKIIIKTSERLQKYIKKEFKYLYLHIGLIVLISRVTF
jgi:hypothetical protein